MSYLLCLFLIFFDLISKQREIKSKNKIGKIVYPLFATKNFLDSQFIFLVIFFNNTKFNFKNVHLMSKQSSNQTFIEGQLYLSKALFWAVVIIKMSKTTSFLKKLPIPEEDKQINLKSHLEHKGFGGGKAKCYGSTVQGAIYSK